MTTPHNLRPLNTPRTNFFLTMYNSNFGTILDILLTDQTWLLTADSLMCSLSFNALKLRGQYISSSYSVTRENCSQAAERGLRSQNPSQHLLGPYSSSCLCPFHPSKKILAGEPQENDMGLVGGVSLSYVVLHGLERLLWRQHRAQPQNARTRNSQTTSADLFNLPIQWQPLTRPPSTGHSSRCGPGLNGSQWRSLELSCWGLLLVLETGQHVFNYVSNSLPSQDLFPSWCKTWKRSITRGRRYFFFNGKNFIYYL